MSIKINDDGAWDVKGNVSILIMPSEKYLVRQKILQDECAAFLESQNRARIIQKEMRDIAEISAIEKGLITG